MVGFKPAASQCLVCAHGGQGAPHLQTSCFLPVLSPCPAPWAGVSPARAGKEFLNSRFTRREVGNKGSREAEGAPHPRLAWPAHAGDRGNSALQPPGQTLGPEQGHRPGRWRPAEGQDGGTGDTSAGYRHDARCNLSFY